MKILAVTFLTNQNRNDLDLSLIKNGNIDELVTERACNAFLAGADGVICSPLEANLIRQKNQFSDKIISTPPEAIRAGANYIVVGRPIWNAKDPILAVDKILKDMCI